MSISSTQKKDIISEFSRGLSDTGSPEVQIAITTNRINYLTDHLKKHVKDFASRRGLLKLVSRRRKLLDYLAEVDRSGYEKIIEKLNIRK